MTSSNRRIAIATSTTAMALALAACGFGGTAPLEHGTVKKKSSTAAYSTPIYRDVYRKTNCRTVTTNALTLSGISRPSTVGGSRGRSTTGGGGITKVKPAQPGKNKPNKLGKDNNPGGSKGSRGNRRICDREFVRRDFVRTDYHPAVWKVKITDGDRSAWKRVSEAKWRKIKVGDRI
ncbi:hypothetical protein ABT173_28810 [Streptomyces sp. NPDC001795]|uniref:hypothetical protein n=1 Tax=unclassified Streptomyces TaxID=2593676 RepID=UPI0033267CCA